MAQALLRRAALSSLVRTGISVWPQRLPLLAAEGIAKAAEFDAFQRRQFATTGKYIHKVPVMGDSITEGSILGWQKKEGDFVAEDEVFVTIETDKVGWN
jgi:hypothetical protein